MRRAHRASGPGHPVTIPFADKEAALPPLVVVIAMGVSPSRAQAENFPEIVAFRGPCPKTTDDLFRFPRCACYPPLSARARGAAAVVLSAPEKQPTSNNERETK